jgi:uncharacterized protein (TIGR00288 family)
MNEKNKIAVLIDGDNAESSELATILSEISKYGKITIKRVYGDWTTPNMNTWKESINDYSVRPMQKFSYTKGKNSTDSALIIDAMDILYSKNVLGFCIVSSDSDYTGLVQRIREEGLFVMGVGKKCTPKSLINSYDTFVYQEILRSGEDDNDNSKTLDNEIKTNTPKLTGPKVVGKIDISRFENKVTRKTINPKTIDRAYKMIANDQGWALASRMKESLLRIDPSFDARNYGYSSFRKFLEALVPPYEVKYLEDNTTVSIIKHENGK